MKLRILLATIFVFGLAVSVALADPGHGQGKKDDPAASTTGATSTSEAEESKGKERGKHYGAAAAPECRPKVSFILRGSLVSYGADSMTMDVTKANRHGRSYVGTQLSLAVGEKTKVRRHGPAELGELETGDLLKVHVRACKNHGAEAGSQVAVSLYAKRVIAKDATPDEEESEGTTTTTTTTSTTNATTTTETTTTAATTTETTATP